MTAGFSRRGMMAMGAGLGMAVLAGGSALAAARPRPAKPLLMAHRGCSALRPEHTLASYAKAIADGADFIEPDLVSTKDGVLVARHENNIAETTDVAARPEFTARRALKVIDGEKLEGWFTEDFTLAELKTLRAKERLGALRPESMGYDGQFQIVTFEEVIDFVAAEAAARGRTIGIIPEIKHSTYFNGIGLPVEDMFLARVKASRVLATMPMIVQSFEIANLKRLRTMLAGMANVQLMQLIDDDAQRPADVAAVDGALTYGAMLTPAGLTEIALYADWVAPATRRIIPLGADGRLAAPTSLVADAHKAGLLVGTWTFRPENTFLAGDFRDGGDARARNPEGSVREILRYLQTGLDGFFTDDPALGYRALHVSR